MKPQQPRQAGFAPHAKGPLHSIRVVDMTRLAAGNMLTHMLADFGAEVIKIERRDVGDDLRRFGPDETWWKVYARSKKSFALNFRDPRGMALLLDLIAQSDVVVENFVPGTLEKWGMGPTQLLERNDKLVIIRITGWGQTGPYASKPGFGSLIEGMSGFAAMTGFPDKPPLLPPLALADMIAGLSGFGACMTALFACHTNSAAGQVIDLSLFEPMHGILGPWETIYKVRGTEPQREGNRSEVAAPRNVYRCSDGKYLAMSASMQSMWEKLAQAVGRGDLIDESRFATNLERVKHADELDAIIGEFIGSRTLQQNLEYFGAAGVTVGPIYGPAELIDHEYIRGRGVLVDVDDPDLGAIPMHAVFPRLSGTPGVIRTPAPRLGEHNEEILDLLNIDQGTRIELREHDIA